MNSFQSPDRVNQNISLNYKSFMLIPERFLLILPDSHGHAFGRWRELECTEHEKKTTQKDLKPRGCPLRRVEQGQWVFFLP